MKTFQEPNKSNMYSKFLNKVLLPSIEFFRGTKIIKTFHFLEKTQWWDASKIRELQNKKLRTLIKHAYENVPYYYRIFQKRRLHLNDIQTVDDLYKLPILTKKIIKENFYQNIVAKTYNKDRLQYVGTSGSTGEPLQLFRDQNVRNWAWAALLRYYSWLDFKIGEKMVNLWGSPFNLTKKDKIFNKIKSLVLNTIELSAFEMSPHILEYYLEKIQQFQPKLIRGYASAVYLLVKIAEEKHVNNIRPKAVSTTAQMLFPFQRKLIQDQFHCEVFDQYGCGETLMIAAECEKHNGYHITDEHVIVELLRGDTKVPPHEIGEVTITDLDNYAMPFIRYKNGDLAVLSDKKCPCGRGLSLLESIEGRTQDLIVTPSGKFFTVEFFVVFFEYLEGVKQFQIIQKKDYQLIVKIVKNQKFKQADLAFIYSKLRENLGNDMELVVEFVDSIPANKSGKYKFVISQVSTNF